MYCNVSHKNNIQKIDQLTRSRRDSLPNNEFHSFLKDKDYFEKAKRKKKRSILKNISPF